MSNLSQIPEGILKKYPILRYRVQNFLKGRNVRGLQEQDNNRCPLSRDDSIIAGEYHFPCIIYMREGGDPIGKVGSTMREERARWSEKHNTHKDPICKKNCLDVCIDFNNKSREFEKKLHFPV